MPTPASPVIAVSGEAAPSLSDSHRNATAYLAAFERALERAPAPLRHRSVDDLEEELSWLDSRGAAALLETLGSPREAARRILVTKVAADRLCRRRRWVAASTVCVGLLGATLLIATRSRRRALVEPVDGAAS